MSEGLLLLSSIIHNGSRDVFRGLSDRMFTENELPVWRFVSHYFDTYGALPSRDVLNQERIILPQAEGDVGYFRSRLQNRTLYNIYLSMQAEMFEAFQAVNMAEFMRLNEVMVQQMRQMDTRRDSFTMTEAMQLVIADYEEAQRHFGLRGITYGFDTLDDITGGARAGDLITLVARPGLGKSMTITRMAAMAWGAGASIGFASMEMTALETARRLLAMGSGVSADLIQRGHTSEWGDEQIRATAARVGDLPPFNMLVGDLSKSVRDIDAMIQEHEPDVIYIDASYLLSPTKDMAGKRFELVSETMRELKSLAVSRNKPIIQTVQFNRSQKQDEEMTLDNIGQSDEIGQLSSLVLGIKKGATPNEATSRRFKILKNRHGPDSLSFATNFRHTPFNMDEIEEEPDGAGFTPTGDWDGSQVDQPTNTEWEV